MAENKTAETEKTSASSADTFTKEEILMSERFQNRRDILHALLSDEGSYTIKNVEQIIEKYMKGTVR